MVLKLSWLCDTSLAAELECFALVFAIKKFRMNIEGHPFDFDRLCKNALADESVGSERQDSWLGDKAAGIPIPAGEIRIWQKST